MRELVPVGVRKFSEEVPIRALSLTKWRLRLHIDGFVFCLALALYRANLDAEFASGAVFRRNLQRVTQTVKLPPARPFRFETFRRISQQLSIVNLCPNDRVRTNQNALAALNA